MLIHKIDFQAKDTSFPKRLPFYGNTIPLQSSVTFFVGDNGSGKSTLLELIAEKLRLIRIYQPKQTYEKLTASLEQALDSFTIAYTTRPKGVFFGAEDFTSYIHSLEQEKMRANIELERVEREYQHKSAFSKGQARMPYARTLNDIEQLHENDLLRESHGEAYLDFFKSRIRDHNLYLLDEPETPLSIQNQFALMIIIKDAIKRGCQFLIATHSPVLTAFPDAVIYELTDSNIQVRRYDELTFVQTMKDFLNHKDRYLQRLFDDDLKNE